MVVISAVPSWPIGVTQERTGLAVDEHRAGAALRQAAAELAPLSARSLRST